MSTQELPQPQLTVSEFAGKVRAKYPGSYTDLSDGELVSKIIAKYPQYGQQINFSPNAGLAGVAKPSDDMTQVNRLTGAPDLLSEHEKAALQPVIENQLRDYYSHDPQGMHAMGTVSNLLQGGSDIAHGKLMRGTHETIKGVGIAASPLIVPALAANPLATATALGMGYGVGKVGKYGTALAGGGQDAQNLAEDVGNILGGMGGAKLGGAVSGAISSPKGKAVASAIKPLLMREVSGRIPIAGRFEGARKPTFGEYLRALLAEPEKPIAETPAPQPSAPYRLSGSQIVDPVTITPRPPFVPKGLLNAAPPEPVVTPKLPFLQNKTPEAAQAEILKSLGVASPKATAKPMTNVPGPRLEPDPRLSFSGMKSGESAATNQLSQRGINQLRAIAIQRGIKVGPRDTHGSLIQKIGDSMTQPEVEAFQQAITERMQPDYSVSPSFIKAARQRVPRVPTNDADMINLLEQSLAPKQ